MSSRLTQCLHCGSDDLATGTLKPGNADAQIIIAGEPDGFLGVVPYTTSPVAATVCRACGFIMLRAKRLTDLLPAHETKRDVGF